MVRMRTTKGRRNNRRAHHGVQQPEQTSDGEGVHIRHRASRETGKYRGRMVLNIKDKKEKGSDEEKQTNTQATIPDS